MPASPTTPQVSVVVPTYQRAERLPPLVDAILADDGVSEAVIVVDGSTDGSIEYLRERAETDERLVPVLTPNRGDVAARRAGVERASGEVVLMLDDDVVPEPGLAAGHARHHSERRDLVVVGYMPVAPWRGPGRRPFTLELYSQDYERACLQYERDPGSILTGLWAGNVSLRREDCLRVGLSSPDFERGYHADRDFGLRCQAAGLTGVFDRSLRAEHRYERDTGAFLRDAYSSGRTRSQTHLLHADVTGPLPPDFYEAGLPAPSRLLVRLARRPLGRQVARGLLMPVLAAAGGGRLPTLERHAGYVLGAIEGQRGALDAARGRPGVGR
jgi:glycosyltransferase involved in cell wall biosynthesis